MVVAARHARNVNTHWKEVYRQLEPRLGPNKALVAIARKLLVAIWHVLTRREADRHANPAQVASGFIYVAYGDVGARNLPDGMTAPEFVRRNLDALGIGKDLQRVKYGKHECLLPPSSLPGAPPAATPTGRGQRQNTKAAKEARATQAAAKREALAQKRAEAEARMGRPRKTRADKGTKRGPHKGKTK